MSEIFQVKSRQNNETVICRRCQFVENGGKVTVVLQEKQQTGFMEREIEGGGGDIKWNL